MLFINKEGFSSRALNRLKRLAAFHNPEFYKMQAMRESTWDKQIPRLISCSDETEQYLCLPRGCKNDVLSTLSDTPIHWQDERNRGRSIDVAFTGVLRTEQSTACAAILSYDNGILAATQAFGKTVVGAALIAEHKVNTLILVDRQPLLEQWIARLTEFLIINESLPELSEKRDGKKKRSLIGIFSGGKNNLNGIIDIAMYQSLVSRDIVKDHVKDYGMVIVDECHHVAAKSYERVLKEVNARYVYGLTATPKRSDGHQPIVFMQCGDIRYKDDPKLQAQRRPFAHHFIPRFTSYRLPIDKDGMRLQDINTDLCQYGRRNDMIIADVLQAVAEGRNPLVLSDRKAHIDVFEKALREKIPNLIVLTGGKTLKERKQLFEQVASAPEDQPLVIIATGKFIGEGFDALQLPKKNQTHFSLLEIRNPHYGYQSNDSKVPFFHRNRNNPLLLHDQRLRVWVR
jgi:superfamily II DNA or RNA helicase